MDIDTYSKEWLEELKSFAKSCRHWDAEEILLFLEGSDWVRWPEIHLCAASSALSEIKPLTDNLHKKMVFASFMWPHNAFVKQYFKDMGQ